MLPTTAPRLPKRTALKQFSPRWAPIPTMKVEMIMPMPKAVPMLVSAGV